MTTCLHSSTIARDLQIQRMDLAYKQMCSQLHDDDSSWYAYALFQITTLGDVTLALQTVQSGLMQCDNKSFALINLLACIQDPRNFNISMCSLSENVRALIRQRLALSNLVHSKTNEHIREFRAIGKESATKGMCEWKLYSQWCASENTILSNDKMATKVLENGMVCCSALAKDTILLEQEAIRYHLNHGREREALGCTEQQIELLSQNSFSGQKRSAWNMLVRTEQEIGLPALDAEARRNVFFPQSRLYSFFERCAVSNYLPCDAETWWWLRLTEDIISEVHQQREATNTTTQPARHRAIVAPLMLSHEYSNPDPKHWTELPSLSDSYGIGNFNDGTSSDSPDDVVGPRELRGRWVYRIKNSYATAARLKREERQQGGKRGAISIIDTTEGPIAGLLKRLKKLVLKEAQREKLSHFAPNTLVQWLATTNVHMKYVPRHRPVHRFRS